MNKRIISTHQKCWKNCSEETCSFGLCECLNALKRGIDLNDFEKFKGEQQVHKRALKMCAVPQEVIERKFIMNFIQDIPLEQLKHLFNFQYIDPEDESLWGKSPEMDNMLKSLQSLELSKMTLEIVINKRVKL